MVIIRIIKFLYNDIRTDFIFIYRFIRNGFRLNNKQHEIAREIFNPKGYAEAFKENYIWFIIVLLAFVVGFFLAAKYYQSVCNEFIYYNYIIPKLSAFNVTNISVF